MIDSVGEEETWYPQYKERTMLQLSGFFFSSFGVMITSFFLAFSFQPVASITIYPKYYAFRWWRQSEPYLVVIVFLRFYCNRYYLHVQFGRHTRNIVMLYLYVVRFMVIFSISNTYAARAHICVYCAYYPWMCIYQAPIRSLSLSI